ncbi:MAG: hypothetical protein HUK40_11670 [Desulfobacter sp.]|nr:hypothetical protein [Desulfobacter sp.]WDP84443.1 MAG: hypothetical protein HUN05_04180 [Desulfobacter sp.]
MNFLGQVLPEKGLIFQVFEYGFILGFVLLAAWVSRVYMIRIDPRIQGQGALRTKVLAACFFIFAAGYGWVVLTGERSNVLTCVLTLNLVLFASVLGSWLAVSLKRPAELVPVCVVVSLADLFSVFAGPTRNFAENISGYYEGGMKGIPPLVDFFLLKMPLPGSDLFLPVFGVSDWVVIVFLCACAEKFKMNDSLVGKQGRLYFPIACLGLCLSIFSAWWGNLFLPALPFISLGFAGVMAVRYPEMRKLTKAEIRPMLGFSALLIGLIIMVRVFR